jgi:hypothetical protein
VHLLLTHRIHRQSQNALTRHVMLIQNEECMRTSLICRRCLHFIFRAHDERRPQPLDLAL